MRIKKQDLLKGLREIGKFTGDSRVTRNVLVDGDAGWIAASSYEGQAFYTMKMHNAAGEKFCVNPRTLNQIVRSLENDQVELSTDSTLSLLQVGDCFQKIPVSSQLKFPKVNSLYGTVGIHKVCDLEKEEVKYLATVPYEDDIPYREFVELDIGNGRLAAVDGRRFHIIRKDGVKGKGKAVFSGFVLKKMSGRSWEMYTTPSISWVVFRSGNLQVQTENEDSIVQFPDYSPRLKTQMTNVVKIKTPEFRRLVQQALLVSGKEYRAGRFTFDGEEIFIHIENPEKGAYNKTGAKVHAGKISPAYTIKLDLGMLADALPGNGLTKIAMESPHRFVRLQSGQFVTMLMQMV